jgi:hypothetical protein
MFLQLFLNYFYTQLIYHGTESKTRNFKDVDTAYWYLVLIGKDNPKIGKYYLVGYIKQINSNNYSIGILPRILLDRMEGFLYDVLL